MLALYLTLAYVTYYTKGFYPYTFLDIQAQGSAVTAGYILGIAVGAVIVFSIVKGVIHLRLWATEKKGGMEGKFAGKPLRSRGSGDVSGVEDVEMGRVEKLGSSGGDGSPVTGSDPRR